MSFDLKAQPRTAKGSRPSRKLREQGRVPASVAGEGKTHVDIHFELAEFFAARRRHEALFDIQIEGGGVETAVIRELQWDPLGERLLHVDFRRVTRGVPIEAEVDLHFHGQSKQGVITPVHDRLLIRAIPSKIPESLEIQVDHLPAVHIILAKHLRLPEGVELACPPDMQVAVMAAATPEEAEEGEEAAEGPSAGEGEKPATS